MKITSDPYFCRQPLVPLKKLNEFALPRRPAALAWFDMREQIRRSSGGLKTFEMFCDLQRQNEHTSTAELK